MIPCLELWSLPGRSLPAATAGTDFLNPHYHVCELETQPAVTPQRRYYKENNMPNFKRIIPVLTYQDIPGAHDFLVRAFGFNAGGVYRDAEGQPVHGEIHVGDATIWLHRVTAEHGLDSPMASDVANSGLFVDVDDVDPHYERARAAWGRIAVAHA